MFAGIPQGFRVTRYHSLAIVKADGTACDFPPDVEKLAWTEDGVVMALAHRTHPQWGVQVCPCLLSSPLFLPTAQSECAGLEVCEPQQDSAGHPHAAQSHRTAAAIAACDASPPRPRRPPRPPPSWRLSSWTHSSSRRTLSSASPPWNHKNCHRVATHGIASTIIMIIVIISSPR